MKYILLTAFLASLALSGCNYEFRETPQPDGSASPAENVRNAEAVTAPAAATDSAKDEEIIEGGKLVLADVSATASYPCGGREVEIDEMTTASTFTLTGECKSILVDGVSNKVYAEKAVKIAVRGTSNKVFVDKVGEISVDGPSLRVEYGGGITGKPKISKSGPGSSVEQKGREEGKKENTEKK